MGRLFEIWIWILLPISVNGQVLFDDFGDRQRSVEFMRTELQKFNQGIERITKKLEGIENNVETKIRNMIESISKNIVKEEKTLIRNSSDQPTMKDETIRDILSAIQTEQQLLRQGMDATSNLTIRADEKISGLMVTTRDAMAILKGTETRPQKRDDLQTSLKAVTTTDESNNSVSFCTNKMAVEFGTNLQMLQDGIENFTLIFENKLNILDEIRTTSQYLSDQLLSGDDIFLIKFNKSYQDMDSQFLLTLSNHNLNSTANRDVILVKRDTILGNDCADILQKYPNARRKNGVYNIFDTSSDSSNTSKAKAVYCDMTTDNGGWTVIQKRVNGSVAFYRDWRAYKNGFGVAEHEYWIGNDMLHRLTSLRPQELRVDMQSFKSVKAYSVYSKFLVGDEASKYRLEVFGYYRGNAGDSLTKMSNNMSFSTPDQDNDGGSGNCAAKFKTAGWFNDCFWTNFNGLYANYEKYSTSHLTWYEWNYWNSLKTFQMMIRPQV